MDTQFIYEMPSVSRCLVSVMLSVAALGIDRPQRRSMTTARQANLVHLNSYDPLVFLLPPLMAAAGYGAELAEQ